MRGNAEEDGQTGANTNEAWPPRPSWSRTASQPPVAPGSDSIRSLPIDGRAVTARIGRADRVLPRPVELQSGEGIDIGGWLRGYGSEGRRSGATVARSLLRLALFGGVLAGLVLGADLGWHWTQEGHANAAAPSAGLAPGTPPVSTLRMGSASSGVPAVDDALRGFLEGDADQALARLVVQKVRCGTLPVGGAPALACLATEAPGTEHKLVLSLCEPKWVTPEAARAELGALLADRPGLYAVARASTTYTAVLSWPDAPDRSLVLAISSAGVMGYGAGCGLPLAAKPGRELDYLIAPGR